METPLKTCFKCHNMYKDCTELNTCKHCYCQKCLLRTLLKHHMLEIPDKDKITIRCKCKQGSCELSLDNITEIIKNNQEIAIKPCSNHNQPIVQTCKECKKNLCKICLNSHSDLFQDHHLIPIEDITSSDKSNQLGNEQCSDHLKDFEAYCKNCKMKLCQICLFDNDKHKEHEIIKYETYISKIKEFQDKLQFKTFEAFNEYVTKIEKEFDTAYNVNLSNTTTALENIINLITKTLNDYQTIMEQKKRKKEIIMNIIRKVYKRYYDDFKIVEKSNNHLCLKFLSKQYDEFAEVNFRSDFDSIMKRLNEIKDQLKNEDISNMVKVSYAYFAKRDLVLKTQIKNDKTQKDQINEIIELKDGKIISASEDNTIYVFDKDGKSLYILKGHVSGVRCLCTLPGNRIASGSADRTIRIWDTKSFKTLNVLKDHSNPVIGLSLLTGDKMASCSLREIIIYDNNLKATYFLGQHTNWVRSCIQLDKTKIVSCSDDGSIIVYDKFFRVLNSYKDHREMVLSICKLRDGRFVSGDRAGKLIVWSKNLAHSREVVQHTNGILSIKQLKDGRIVTASMDQTIRLWDLDFKVLHVYKEHQGNVNTLAILRDGGFVSGGADCLINVWR